MGKLVVTVCTGARVEQILEALSFDGLSQYVPLGNPVAAALQYLWLNISFLLEIHQVPNCISHPSLDMVAVLLGSAIVTSLLRRI